MPQPHLSVPDEAAALLRERARARPGAEPRRADGEAEAPGSRGDA